MTTAPSGAQAGGPQEDGNDFLLPLRWRPLRWLDGLTSALNACGTLLILAVMLTISADVISRQAWNTPLHGVPELVSLSIVVIVFLQVPHAFRVGGLTRAEILLDRLPLRARAMLEVLHSLAGAGFCVILFNSVLPLFGRAWSRGTYVGNIGDFTAPIWPVRLIMLVGAALLGLRFFVRAIQAARTVIQS